ncbi:protein THYLAKOID ASSEMBLY 8-like, chloroplastic [Lotus japonicus]|uniref:protein THYLAKOID ASSEMBLY 8-like, chloroplastic n=1 Tax=Lotus japonicus TaxID=34305 RepID=UPI002588BA11|nr:protein THYLAKOID ASSEMBLY 8-like, chloroplastic [Lotus japonicus]
MILRLSDWTSVQSFQLQQCIPINEEPRSATSISKRSINFGNQRRGKSVIVCGLRASFRKRQPSRVISKEGIQVIHALKLAKSSEQKLYQVLNEKLTRLLNADALDLLGELQRQNELHLSLKVFNFLREEPGFDALLPLYSDMILLLGRNKMVGEAEELFSQVVEKGLKPDTRMFTEMIGVYLQGGNTEKAMELYRSMKASGCSPDKLTFTILIRSLEKSGEQELVETLKQECVDYIDLPDKFIQQIEQKQVKEGHVNLV